MTHLLLDTIVLLWWLSGDKRLEWSASNRIARPTGTVFVSVATAWEISALERGGKIDFGCPASDCLPREMALHRFEWLEITHRHVFLAQQLPRDTLDPYDRLIVAQASLEGLMLVTTNPAMGRRPGIEIMDAQERIHAGPVNPLPPSEPDDPVRQRPVPKWNAFPWGGTTSV